VEVDRKSSLGYVQTGELAGRQTVPDGDGVDPDERPVGRFEEGSLDGDSPEGVRPVEDDDPSVGPGDGVKDVSERREERIVTAPDVLHVEDDSIHVPEPRLRGPKAAGLVQAVNGPADPGVEAVADGLHVLKDAPEAVLGPPQGDESPVVFGPEVLEGRATLAVDGGRMAEKGYAAASDQGSPEVRTFKADEHEDTHPRSGFSGTGSQTRSSVLGIRPSAVDWLRDPIPGGMLGSCFENEHMESASPNLNRPRVHVFRDRHREFCQGPGLSSRYPYPTPGTRDLCRIPTAVRQSGGERL
jgi:hypothetical protein